MCFIAFADFRLLSSSNICGKISNVKTETALKTRIVRQANRVPRWVLPSVKVLIFTIDALLAIACFALAFVWRENAPVFKPTAWAWSQEFVPYAGVILFAVPIRLIMLFYQRVFRLQGAFSYLAEFIKIFKAILVGSLLIIAFTFLFRSGYAFRDFSYSRGIFILDFALAVTAFSAFHLGLRYVQTLFRNNDINLIPTLVVGTNAEAEQTIRELKERRDLGFRIVGVIGNNKLETMSDEQSKNVSFTLPPSSFNGVPVVGAINDLPEIIKELAIQEVIITDQNLAGDRLFEAMMQIGRRQKVEFRLAPSLFNFLPQKTSVEQIGVLPMVRLFREPLTEAERFLKRVSDIVISTLIILATSPLWLIISALIKFDSPGSIFFKQERVGMDGRRFLFYKFRTMRVDSDENLHREIYKKNIQGLAEANAGDVENPVFGKVKNDPRVTRVGRFLRRTSLDELPQFLNVLLGEMSVVGARPPIPYEVEEYGARHRRRLEMKPGITGLWQVSGRNRLTFEEMVQTDLYYIENWSIWLDLKIMLLTLPAMWRGDGEK